MDPNPPISTDPGTPATPPSAASARPSIADAFQEIAICLAAVTGQSFFRALTQNLVRLLGIDGAVIAASRSLDADTYETLSVCIDGRTAENFSYRLPGSADDDSLSIRLLEHPPLPPSGVLDHFPREDHLAAPLRNARGEPIGVLSLLARAPIEQKTSIEALLATVAIRCSVELSDLRTRQRLRRTESHFNAFFTDSNFGCTVFDSTGRIVWWNSSAAEILGRFLGPAARIGLDMVGMMRGGPDPEFAQAFDRALRGERPRLERRTPLDDGSSQWFELRFLPVPDSDGQIAEVGILAARIDDRKSAADALIRREERFRSLVQNSSDLIAVLDARGIPRYLSPSCERILGYTAEELVDSSFFQLVHPDDFPYVYAVFSYALERPGEPINLEYRCLHRSGEWVTLESVGTNRFDDRAVNGYILNSRDITERKRAEKALRQAEQKYRSIYENAIEGIFQTTPEGRFVSANPSLARIFGFESPEELVTEATDIASQIYDDPDRRGDFLRAMESHGEVREFESRVRRRDGTVIWISETARAVRDPRGEISYFEGMVEDITKRKRAEEQLLHDAFHDGLTGLPNRALFVDRLERVLERARRHAEYMFSVLVLDIDRFAGLNDSLGHTAGDALLRQAAARLEAALRQEDTAARLGGDEFSILLDGIGDLGDAAAVADRLLAAFRAPFLIEGQEVFSSASVGIALYEPGIEHAEDLLRDADTAMYRAKTLGKDRYAVFDNAMHHRAVAILQLETDLRRSIESRDFIVHYQPIVALDSGELRGFEALVRWAHPQRGLVSPAEFIPIAEETGLINPLGEWVLREACRQVAAWNASFPYLPPLSISVNLSARQFSQSDLIERIASALRETGIAPAHLKLELTESAVMENAEGARATLLELKSLGIQLAIDDFGTGYSSLSYLHRFPIDTLKIDRSFVKSIEERDHDHFAIIRSITTLAHNLSMNVTAEGVENQEQLARLRTLNCEFAQGFLFSRPLPRDEAEAKLRAMTDSALWPR